MTSAAAYDLAGHVTKVRDRNGQTRQFRYDADGRKIAEDWGTNLSSPSYSARWVYDALDRVTTASDDHSTYHYGYDAFGDEVAEDNVGTPDAPGVALATHYDAAQRRDGQYAIVGTDVDFVNSYVYDNADRLRELVQDQAGDTVHGNGPF